MGVGLAIIAGQCCGRYISCDKVFLDSWGPGNPTGSAQCAGSGNGSSRHTVVPLCDLEDSVGNNPNSSPYADTSPITVPHFFWSHI